jgi:hypothetical protein
VHPPVGFGQLALWPWRGRHGSGRLAGSAGAIAAPRRVDACICRRLPAGGTTMTQRAPGAVPPTWWCGSGCRQRTARPNSAAPRVSPGLGEGKPGLGQVHARGHAWFPARCCRC